MKSRWILLCVSEIWYSNWKAYQAENKQENISQLTQALEPIFLDADKGIQDVFIVLCPHRTP